MIALVTNTNNIVSDISLFHTQMDAENAFVDQMRENLEDSYEEDELDNYIEQCLQDEMWECGETCVCIVEVSL
jgi:hypothetical protein